MNSAFDNGILKSIEEIVVSKMYLQENGDVALFKHIAFVSLIFFGKFDTLLCVGLDPGLCPMIEFEN